MERAAGKTGLVQTAFTVLSDPIAPLVQRSIDKVKTTNRYCAAPLGSCVRGSDGTKD